MGEIADYQTLSGIDIVLCIVVLTSVTYSSMKYEYHEFSRSYGDSLRPQINPEILTTGRPHDQRNSIPPDHTS